MNDEELLQRSEDKIRAAQGSDDMIAAQALATESIAASLLVIARNSVKPKYDGVSVMDVAFPKVGDKVGIKGFPNIPDGTEVTIVDKPVHPPENHEEFEKMMKKMKPK